MTPRKKFIVIIIVLFIVISIITIIVAIVNQNNNEQIGSNEPPKQTTSVDEVTGETIIETEGKVPEGVANDGVIILGFSKLIDYGLSSNQVSQVKNAMVFYTRERLSNVKRISLDFSTAKMSVDQESGNKKITADIVIDNERRQLISMTYVSINDMWVQIFNKETNQELYNSSLHEY